MSSGLMSSFLLRRSSWYSNSRLMDSRPLRLWNSRTSSPSGVTSSITLGMSVLDECESLPPADDQARHRSSRFHAQLGFRDLVLEAVVGQQLLDVPATVRIAAVGLEPEVAHRLADRVLEREDQESTGVQRSCRRRQDAVQGAEVHQRVGRYDDVERAGVIAQVRGELCLDQLVVQLLLPGLCQHAG